LQWKWTGYPIDFFQAMANGSYVPRMAPCTTH
jgi:hypothetical protein